MFVFIVELFIFKESFVEMRSDDIYGCMILLRCFLGDDIVWSLFSFSGVINIFWLLVLEGVGVGYMSVFL